MRFRNLAVATSVVTYLTILVGGYTRGSGAGYGCRDAWPLCAHPETGALHLFPDWSNTLMVIEWSHRFVALAAGVLIVWLAVAAWRRRPVDTRARAAATIAGVLLPVQALLGAATVWFFLDAERHGVLATLHMGTAAALFAAVVATTIFAFYPPPGARAGARSRPDVADAPEPPRASPGDYARIMKPRIMALLVAMGFTGIVLAPGGVELSPVTMFWTLLGGALAAGAGGVINQVIERDLDKQMARTADRPLASGRIQPADAMAFALALAAVSFTMLAFMVNVLAAVLTQLAVLFYVFVYTLWLKPSTPQGVVIGGAAGSVPALVGWAAVTNEIGLPALLLGLLVFVWTPPHFWALAIAKRDEYGAAGFPMMPLVKGIERTKREMVLYTLATLIVAGALYLLGYLGSFYGVVSTVLGLAFLGAVLHVVRDKESRRARGLFFFSLWYLGLLFVAIVVDRVAFG